MANVVVPGMHRSGASAVTRVLNLRPIRSLWERYLRSAGPQRRLWLPDHALIGLGLAGLYLSKGNLFRPMAVHAAAHIIIILVS